jgi:hypothetical protein
MKFWDIYNKSRFFEGFPIVDIIATAQLEFLLIINYLYLPGIKYKTFKLLEISRNHKNDGFRLEEKFK